MLSFPCQSAKDFWNWWISESKIVDTIQKRLHSFQWNQTSLCGFNFIDCIFSKGIWCVLRRVFLFKMKGICIQKKTSATKVKQKAVIDYSCIAFVIYTLHHQRHYSQCLKPRARLEHFQSPNAKIYRETKWKSVRKSVRA